MLDPTTLLLYRLALSGIILVLLIVAIYMVSKIGSAQGISGLRGFAAWAVTDGKSYGLAIIGGVSTAAYALDYLSFDRWTVIMGLVNGTAIATLRASQGKTQAQAKQAAGAAEEAVSLAATAVARQRPVTPKTVAPEPPAPQSPQVRIPRASDLGGAP